jgi:hypothetical protein
LEEYISSFRWYNSIKDELKRTKAVLGYFSSINGVWAGLLNNLIQEYRNQSGSRKVKALSVDRMLAWSHHNSLMANYTAGWLPMALDARAHGNMNTLLANASIKVRDGIKSASHGIGRPDLTEADRIHACLSRDKSVTKITRDGNHFTVSSIHHQRIQWGGQPNDPAVTEFTVENDGLRDIQGELHPFLYVRYDGSKYKQDFDDMFRRLPKSYL